MTAPARRRQVGTGTSQDSVTIVRIGRDLRPLRLATAGHRIPALARSRTGEQAATRTAPYELDDRLKAQCRAVLRTGKPRTFECASDDQCIRYRVLPERGSSGKVGSILVVADDVSESRRSESALRESASRAQIDHRIMMLLVDLGCANASTGDLRPALVRVLDAAMLSTGADFGNIQVLDPDLHTPRIVAHRGFPKWWLRRWRVLSAGEGVRGRTLGRHRRTFLQDVTRSRTFARTEARDLMLRAGVRSVLCAPLRGRDGSVLGILSVHFRVQQRPDEHARTLLDLLARQAAEMIERSSTTHPRCQSEDAYHTIFNHMTDAVSLWRLTPDRHGRIGTWRLLDINPAGLKAWGRTRKQTIGKLADDISPGATRQFMPVVRRIFADGHAHSWETYVPRLKQHLKMTCVPLGDCFVTTGVDISASKVAALALHVSEERLRLSLQASQMGAFDWDLVSGKVAWTPNNERLWGLKPGQFKGTVAQVRSLLHPEDRTRCQAMIRRALAGSRHTFQMEHRIVRPDKSVRWIATKASIIRDKAGRPVRIVGVHADVTKQLAARAHLESERDRLGRLVRERTAEILRVQQQSRISERLCGLGTLVAGLGHDMNNVLLPVRADIEVLKADQRRLPARSQRSVDAISGSVAYLQELTDSLHLLAAEPGIDQNGSTDLSQWWSRARPILISAVPKRVHVSARIPRNLPKVAISSHSLTQAVLNLMVNAGEAMPAERRDPPGRITILATARSPRTVQLVVKDNGRGMTDSVRRRAFDMFFSTRPRGMGTGLGLALVRRLLDRVGGRVTIASAVGRGTSVTLSLPTPRRVQSGDALTAAISIKDHRAAAMTRHLLEAWNVHVAAGEAPDRADIWVIEPDSVLLPQAERWRARRGQRGRLVIVGAPLTPSERQKWKSLSPLIVQDPMDLVNLRATLAKAVTIK